MYGKIPQQNRGGGKQPFPGNIRGRGRGRGAAPQGLHPQVLPQQQQSPLSEFQLIGSGYFDDDHDDEEQDSVMAVEDSPGAPMIMPPQQQEPSPEELQMITAADVPGHQTKNKAMGALMRGRFGKVFNRLNVELQHAKPIFKRGQQLIMDKATPMARKGFKKVMNKAGPMALKMARGAKRLYTRGMNAAEAHLRGYQETEDYYDSSSPWSSDTDGELEGQVVPLQEGEVAKEELNIAPVEIVLTVDQKLAITQFRLSADTRKTWEYILLAFSVLAFLFPFCEFLLITEVDRLVMPFTDILIERQEDKRSGGVNARNRKLLYIHLVAYLLVNFARIFFILKVLEMEDEEYQKKPSAWPFTFMSIIWLFPFILGCTLTVIFSGNLNRITGNFTNIFQNMETQYDNAPGTVMSEIDIMQRTFQCCGSDGYRSWYSVELGRAMRAIEDAEVELYWKLRLNCHYNGKLDSNLEHNLQLFKRAHSPEYKETNREIKPVRSVPFSCCNLTSAALCNFYDNNNDDKFWKDSDSGEYPLYLDSCQKKIRPQLSRLGLIFETITMARILLELFLFPQVLLLKSSFVSHYEHHHRPSIVSLPMLVIISVIVFPFLAQLWLFKFISWYYFGQTIANWGAFSDEELQEYVDSMAFNATDISTYSTVAPS